MAFAFESSSVSERKNNFMTLRHLTRWHGGDPSVLTTRSWRAGAALSFVLLFVAALFPHSIFAQQGGTIGPVTAEDATRLAQFEQSLDALRQQHKIPGLSAAIVNGGRIVWERGFGFQDLENGIQATPDTPYRIASLTKTFASMLLMKCVEQGNLNLDTPIINYTNLISEPGVTVRHLFTHTSENPPGAFYRYNGNRYGALTPVVDACTGRPYREVLAKTILDRLEMWDSVPGQDMEFPTPEVAQLFTPDALQRYSNVIQRLAKPYTLNSHDQIVLSAYPPRGINAAAGLISTVRDLARYDAAIDNHLLLQAQTQELAWTNAVSSWTGQTLPYALGWFVQQYRGERLIWHYGLWNGSFSALILKVPGRHVTLILLANSDGLSAPFSSLGAGNVTGSPFAGLFLQMLADPGAFTANPIDTTPFFVRQHYRDFLNREPEPGGYQGWQDILNNCGAGDTHCDRIEVSSAFFRSPEFQERGYFIYRFYAASLGRVPHYSEFMPDMAQVSGFLTPEQQEASKIAFINGLMTRDEFMAKYASLSDPRAFVEALEKTAGVALAQKEALIADLAANRKTRAEVLRAIAGSPEVYAKFYTEAFVVMQYFGYLRRDPDILYLEWIRIMNENGGDYRGMISGFVNSAEYRRRFGP
jgi:CubicO group peptidase (beta-lactamase class C family)